MRLMRVAHSVLCVVTVALLVGCGKPSDEQAKQWALECYDERPTRAAVADVIFAKGRAKAKAERKVKRVMRDCMVERSRREGY